jgi:citrate lyase subunit beta/citryl-CoA lyase
MHSDADVVILDLEDSVLPARKDEARDAVCAYVARLGTRAARVEVRVNGVGTEHGIADLRALASLPGLHAIRLPSVESVAQVHTAIEVLKGSQRVHCVLESALGVESAFAIGESSALVCGLGLGEADLRADLGIADTSGLNWARARVVVAARAAGLPAPAMSVYPVLDDAAGLAAHCRTGRSLGFVGCAAIHPSQLPVIAACFRPTEEEIAAARQVLGALASGEHDGAGAVRTDDGRMVDAAMRRRAEQVLALVHRPVRLD